MAVRTCQPERDVLRSRLLGLLLLGAGLLATNSGAGTFAEVESTVLGGGWFRYRVRMYPDPFFRQQCMYNVGSSSFSNRIVLGTAPSEWAFDMVGANEAFWQFTNSVLAQTTPYERTFTVQSSETSYRRMTNFYVMHVLWPQTFLKSTNLTDAMIGYNRLPCLVPCPPAQHDGAPTNILTSFEMFPDVEVEGITPYTVSFDWGGDCTVQIQASTNLQTSPWSGVAYALGYEGNVSTWTSPVPLLTYGSFYRVGLVEIGHNTNWLGH